MGETFKAFIAFISEDPIMLGLCIAIVVLIIMFILVLVLGKKKDKKDENTDIVNNNEELLRTEINMEALKSTSEYKLDELTAETSKEELEVKEPVVEEIPVTTEEPIKVEIEDKPLEPTIEPIVEDSKETELTTTPVYPTFDNIQITENRTVEEDKPEEQNVTSEISDDDLNNISIVESNEMPIEDNRDIPYIEESSEPTTDSLDNLNITESTINPIEEETPVEEKVKENSQLNTGFPHFEEINETTEEKFEPVPIKGEVSEPILTEPIEEVPPLDISNITLEDNILSVTPDVQESIPPVKEFTDDITPEPIIEPTEEELPIAKEIEIEQPEKTLEPTSTEELPKQEVPEEEVELPDYSDIYTIDDIELPNINFDEFAKEEPNESSKEEEEDLDLPKLNTNTNASINSLQGESFKIN